MSLTDSDVPFLAASAEIHRAVGGRQSTTARSSSPGRSVVRVWVMVEGPRRRIQGLKVQGVGKRTENRAFERAGEIAMERKKTRNRGPRKMVRMRTDLKRDYIISKDPSLNSFRISKWNLIIYKYRVCNT